MKIEMGESLIYSWLRHEKECQLVQTNWKPSPYWNGGEYKVIERLFLNLREYYNRNYNFNIFKGCAMEQFLKQAEIDVLGISFFQSEQHIIAVDVAYHEAGLNYGNNKQDTVHKVMLKCIRSALCLCHFFKITMGEIVFASPKINPAIENELIPMFLELNQLYKQLGFNFEFTLLCNEMFELNVLKPILMKSSNIADTSELFLRSVQLYNLSSKESNVRKAKSVEEKRVIINEGKAIHKINNWGISPEQNTYKMIRAYYQILKEKGCVSRKDLKMRCQNPNKHFDVYVSNFDGTFNSMKSDLGNNYGKVFVDAGKSIVIWDRVSEALEKHLDLFLR